MGFSYPRPDPRLEKIALKNYPRVAGSGRPFFSGVREVKTSPTTEVGLGRPTFRSGSADWHYLLGLICWLSGFSAQDYLAVLGIDHDGI